ncbi:MAG: hypothetical protein DSY47_02520 [Hydrogenothermus sp.]|nr:MAG: hypothetical protein DSY47_02520 [Hydrogenothermus sp.]
MYVKAFLSLLFFFSFSYSLEVCYKGYYIFFPIIVDCINYEPKKVEAYAYSTPFGSLFKKVKYEGNSKYTYENSILVSKQFYFIQQEGKHKYIHHYVFKENTILYEKRHYKLKNDKYIFKDKKQKTFKTKEIFFDPFTSSVYLYKAIKSKKSGYIPIFYDGRFYKVPYKVEKKEKINIDGKIYKTQKVYLNPEFKSKGLLKPTGNWYLWIDENLNIPVKMQVKFTIGSFRLVLKSLKLEEEDESK